MLETILRGGAKNRDARSRVIRLRACRSARPPEFWDRNSKKFLKIERRGQKRETRNIEVNIHPFHLSKKIHLALIPGCSPRCKSRSLALVLRITQNCWEIFLDHLHDSHISRRHIFSTTSSDPSLFRSYLFVAVRSSRRERAFPPRNVTDERVSARLHRVYSIPANVTRRQTKPLQRCNRPRDSSRRILSAIAIIS